MSNNIGQRPGRLRADRVSWTHEGRRVLNSRREDIQFGRVMAVSVISDPSARRSSGMDLGRLHWCSSVKRRVDEGPEGLRGKFRGG